MDHHHPLRRAALAEIPIRMDLLRVSTDDEEEINLVVPDLVPSPLHRHNIPTSYLSPAPSPDELVIRQRGSTN